MPTETKIPSAAELKAAWKKAQADEKAAKSNAKAKYEKDRDGFIVDTVQRMEQLSDLSRDLKTKSIATGTELRDKMYKALGREPKEGVDSYTVTTNDGTMKVVIETQFRCEYDETSTAAIDTIRQVLREKFEGRNKGMYGIIDGILLKNNKGDYDERLVAKLRKHEEAVDDQRFSEALTILANAYKPTTSQTYIRAYRRDTTNKWREVTMNWSSM